MVVTHFVLAGRGFAGATVGNTVGKMAGGAVVVVVIVTVVVVVTWIRLFVFTGAAGFARVDWISALLARAVLSFSRISSIWSCSSCSSPGWGGATSGGGATVTVGGAVVMGLDETEEAEDDDLGRDSTRLASEAAGPPFSHGRLPKPTLGLGGSSPSPLAPPPLASEAAMRASRRRVLRVSRLK